MSADIPTPTPADVPAVDLGALETAANQKALDAVNNGPDDQTRDTLLFGMSEVPADVAEKMRAHPNAGSGLLGAMVGVEQYIANGGLRTTDPEVMQGLLDASRVGDSSLSEAEVSARAKLLKEIKGNPLAHDAIQAYVDSETPTEVTADVSSAPDKKIMNATVNSQVEWIGNHGKIKPAGVASEIDALRENAKYTSSPRPTRAPIDPPTAAQ